MSEGKHAERRIPEGGRAGRAAEYRPARGGPVVETFGRTRDGAEVQRFTLTNRRGTRASWIDLGATLCALRVADREGRPGDVVLGFDDVAAYEGAGRWFGPIVGPVANRIAGGRFTLDGATHELERNEGPNHLHGGSTGLDTKVWQGREEARPEGPALRFATRRPAGEGGFPGALDVEVTFVLGHDDALAIEYRATTDAPTPVSLTSHPYFDLSETGSVLGHELTLHADHVVEPGPGLVPTGRIVPVEGTALDFRRGKPVGRDLEAAGGYDHCYVLHHEPRGPLRCVARLREPRSGRTLEVHTTEPGLQLYVMRVAIDAPGKGGARYGAHAGLCLEAQGLPDAVNQPGFPSVVLRPGETYAQRTIYRFGVDGA